MGDLSDEFKRFSNSSDQRPDPRNRMPDGLNIALDIQARPRLRAPSTRFAWWLEGTASGPEHKA